MDGAERDVTDEASTPAPTVPEGAAAHVPERIGPFTVVRAIASGGMGTVYEATQEHPQRTVAVKVMRPEMLGRETLHRFHVEADLLARLSHPGIAQVYQAGTYEVGGVEMPYFAMEYVHDAQTLTEYAKSHDLDLRARLELFADVCDAVHFGHQRGVVHRDLKPDNVLIGAQSDPPRPKVIDFGVARATDADVAAATMQTNVGQLVGTLHYMSPEQVEADPSEIDVRSDVYALGVVLYELLAGRLPYELQGEHFLEVVRIIREQEPTRLGTASRALRGDVETIALKALEKEKARRYQSASDLLSDVRAYLDGKPISARPPSTFYQLRTFARRNRAAFTSLVAVFLVSIVAAIVSVRWAFRADSLARSERTARGRVERQLYRANLNSAVEALSGGRLDLAKELLQDTPEELRGWEWSHLESRLDESLGPPLPPEWHSPWLEYSPDGSLMYARDTRSADGPTSVIVDALDGRELLRIPWPVARCFFTPDGEHVFGIRPEYGYERWNIATGERVREVTSITRPEHHCLAMNAVLGRYTFHTKEAVDVRDLDTDRLIARLPGWRHRSAYSTDGRVLMILNGPTVEFLDAETHQEVRPSLSLDVQNVISVAPHPRAHVVALGTSSGEVFVEPIEAGSDRDGVVLRGLRLPVTALAWSSDGRRIAAGTTGGHALVFDPDTAEQVTRLPVHGGWISELVFRPGTHQLHCSDSKGQLRTWSTDLSSSIVIRSHASYVYGLAIAPDGEQLVTGGWDGYLRQPGGLKLHDARTGSSIARHGAKNEVFLAAAYAIDESALITSVWKAPEDDFEVRVLDPVDLSVKLSFDAPRGRRVERIVPHPDGRRVLTIGTEGHALLWELETGEVTTRFDPPVPYPGHGEGVGIAVSPDGELVALTRKGKEIWLHETDSGELVRLWQAHDEAIWSLAFAPDGERLLSASADDTIGVWDVATGEPVTSLVGHGQDVLIVAASPDGTRIASGGRDGYVRIWDTAHHEEVARLAGHEDYVYSLAWAPDGSWLASTSGDNTARVWGTSTLLERHEATRERVATVKRLEASVARALRKTGDPNAALARLGLSGREGQIARQLVQSHASRFGGTAQPGPWGPEVHVAERARGPIVIDGKLDEAAWRSAAWTSTFIDIEGGRKPVPAHATRAKIVWDDEAIYFAAQLDEPHVWGTLTERDSIIYRDNDFEVFIDPDRDALWYYEFEVNALNTMFDLMLDRPYRESGRAIISWDAEGLRHAVHVDGTVNDPSDVDRGWSTEIAVPWEVFERRSRVSLPPEPGDVWKVNFSRVQWQHRVEDGAYVKVPDTREDNWVWSAQHQINMHLPRRWGFVEFAGNP